MSEPALTGSELLSWNEETSERWRTFLTANPSILALECDIAGTKTAAELLQHIVVVELRYAERIARLPEHDYSAASFTSIEELYGIHDRAVALYKENLARGIDWNERIEFMTRSYGPIKSSFKTLLVHGLMHSIRHYAQLGTLVRQHGYKPDWLGDYMAMDFERVPA